MSFIRSIVRSIRIPVSINRNSIRDIHRSPIVFESDLAKLRKKTGYAFALCRKALEQNGQDIMKAEKWLRAEAAKQGWEKAERVKSRTTGQGLIGIYTDPNQLQATMVEVRCETDFVSRNEHFIRLVSELAKKINNQLTNLKANHQQSDEVEKIWITDEKRLKDIGGDLVVNTIQKLGENIRFVRGCLMRIPNNESSQVRLLPYAHAVAGKIESNDPEIVLGKYGTIVAVTQLPESNTSVNEEEEMDTTQMSKNIDELGSRLGQHIIGLSPKIVAPLSTEDTKESPQEEHITGDEEPEALIKQKFIFNEDITVEQFLRNSRANVLDFIRIECGEEQ
ncbi:hypothetical protein DERP_007187 [Dermatophagoides pteronyssinus]|uniref:Elongation factor Ts, mitochondrial n=1 Tax=Dermatophagoides pteronyssinus TaxID=6956 RepID=A0ABQ8JUL1_DERPT|nr:hypothetical protein DERP_007187 [Dermatophagoides pteronyssinus]